MISSIKSQTLKQTTTVSSSTASDDEHTLHQHLIEDMLIRPLNNDDENNLFGETIMVKSTIPSVNENFIDSKVFSNNNSNSDNTNNSILLNSNNIDNNDIILNNNNGNNNINYELKMMQNSSVTTKLNDTQNLYKINNIKKENITDDFNKDDLKNYIMSISSSITSTNTTNSNDISVNNNNSNNNNIKSSNNKGNNNENIDNLIYNNNESEFAINSISTIPINNAKDFSNNNDNNLIQEQKPLIQQDISNNLIKSAVKLEPDSISNSTSSVSNINSNSFKNGMISNNTTKVDDKSALFNSSTNNNSNNKLSFCNISPVPVKLTKFPIFDDSNQITSTCNNSNNLLQSQKQSNEGTPKMTSNFLNNIKVSTNDKISDNNKIATSIATSTTVVKANSSKHSSAGTRVGFISLEQNGWNLNFITTTSLIPPISTTKINNTKKFETPQIPIKTTTINSSCNNRINVFNDNSINSNLKVDGDSNSNKNTINHHVNNAIVNRSLIEDVHNYSKKSKRFPMECVSTTNSSVEESEEDDDPDDDNDDGYIDYEEDGEEEICGNEFDYRKFLTTKTKNKKRFQTLKIDSNIGYIGNKKLQDKIEKMIVDQKEYSTNNEIYKKTQQEIGFIGPSTNNDENGESLLTPEHHARRPMNAFLIFCKRHRAIVRDKYKNIENRQVTKILGEWWENMSQDEKSSYTNLAKEYKDAFLSANPNFKWYKLPAPPLRTLVTRPLNTNESSLEEPLPPTLKQPKHSSPFKQSSPPIEENIPISKEKIVDRMSPIEPKHEGNVGMFKFADETQMGGLSSLITCSNSPNGNNSPDINKIYKSENQNNDHEHLQCPLTETSQFISLAMPKTKPDISNLEPFERMRNHAKEMQLSIKNNKRKILIADNIDIGIGGKKFIRDNSFSSSEEDNWLRKPTRSCKGKKYQELISSGQIATSSKKNKKSTSNTFAQSDFIKSSNIKDSSSDSDGAAATQTNYSDNNLSPLKINVKDEEPENLPNVKKTSDIEKSRQCEDNQLVIQSTEGKPFDTNAFDLEAKIMALPAQDLEEYLQKKQESKCKKKIASKRRKKFNSKKISKSSNSNNNNDNRASPCSLSLDISNQNSSKSSEMQDIITQQKSQQQIDSIKEHIVGSQKRKARKESITRRDLNAIYKTTTPVMTASEPPINWVNSSDIKIESNSEIDNAHYEPLFLQCHEEQPVQKIECVSPANEQLTYQVYEPKLAEPTSKPHLLILAEVASNFDE
ncbi:putative uncharacterized protein DDB_G0282133 [Condylostylus longicornis]|uniref:putative uncharacterized protein DDB_G0282133 n=1 Tax=Condylostylus longicornis TaxID=2530218 RepID=UPI00244E0762|nr:putative uncharacterized protein DDB_G0282133 [Condylostylus longicornis]XP_055381157.1 putative uncharacterized protein DDB_G0282133 [Condylostylus longicornis]XP_055381158.1 putative uncharacterized protein DDB_G0282133 [Condylostylus longicornis]XP_055381159.1 putative uncharacterized protein DDB_G0282133 [Condylostylus longicornis]XP_055381161.1 putative uncharacterized protein DDB_G0282133 [Condylostylus longicornis]XP_055381162.1 putative uncharacterized protein DDB_G0282133 [Condylos